MSQTPIEFVLSFEGTPEKPIAMTLYAFDEKGNMITSAPIARNAAKLALTDDQAKRAKIVLAPTPPKELSQVKVDFDSIQKRQAYVVTWTFDPLTRKYKLAPIPQILWKLWLWCSCQVRGTVVRKVAVGSTVQNWPVYLAKVHICEVDPIWLILKRLPDLQVLKIRDELIKAIGKPIPRPPEPPAPDFEPDVLDFSPENVARMKMAMPIRTKTSLLRLAPQAAMGAPQTLSVPADVKTALTSRSIATVKTTLAANIHLIRPYICLWPWIWPFFLRCDEVAVLLTDKQGKFQTNVWYLCNGDHPDLYFWVEYQIGSAWTTVYHPPMHCNTYWNYVCGTEVTIPISDPRVPWYSDPTPVPGKQVAILSIGHDISMTEIKRAPGPSVTGIARALAILNEGLTTAGEPFGGSLEPTVWFGDAIVTSGITHYRWSYRRLTLADGTPVTDVWHAIDYRVIRHYGEILADGTLTFKPFLLGPDPTVPGAALFQIPPQSPPANPGAIAASWAPQIDARENTASGFFRSYMLSGGNPANAAGKYELKLELFKVNPVAHTVSLLNLTDEGVTLKVPTVDAPFAAGTVPTVAVAHFPAIAADMEDRVIRDAAGKISAFRLVLHVDNNPCEAQIYSTQVTGTPPIAWATVGSCGFLQYSAGAQAIISFRAAHPNNFAYFSFRTVKGSSGPVAVSCAPDPALASPLPLVSAPNVNGFARSTTSDYSKTLLVKDLVGTCPNGTAAFAETLAVYPLATDGWSTLWYLARYPDATAFALQLK
jgi:hypothetical protein